MSVEVRYAWKRTIGAGCDGHPVTRYAHRRSEAVKRVQKRADGRIEAPAGKMFSDFSRSAGDPTSDNRWLFLSIFASNDPSSKLKALTGTWLVFDLKIPVRTCTVSTKGPI
jgi:hypothetical protein